MNINEVVNNRSSIRKYQKKDVSQDLIINILTQAMKTSTSGNMQAYSVIITTDKSIKKDLYPLHFNQSMVTEAPVFLTFCADFNRMKKWLKISNAPQNFDNFMSFMISSIDAILYSQTASMLFEANGLGICYHGTTLANCEKIGNLLNLPSNVVPVVGYSLGYPEEQKQKRDRLNIDGVIHFEKYKDYTGNEVKNIYQVKDELGFERYQQILTSEQKKDVKNLAQVYTKLKYTEESHIEYSQIVMDYLKKQNFI